MKIRYSRFRTLVLTFALGLAVVSVYARMSGYFDDILVDLPVIESKSSIEVTIPTKKIAWLNGIKAAVPDKNG